MVSVGMMAIVTSDNPTKLERMITCRRIYLPGAHDNEESGQQNTKLNQDVKECRWWWWWCLKSEPSAIKIIIEFYVQPGMRLRVVYHLLHLLCVRCCCRFTYLLEARAHFRLLQ